MIKQVKILERIVMWPRVFEVGEVVSIGVDAPESLVEKWVADGRAEEHSAPKRASEDKSKKVEENK